MFASYEGEMSHADEARYLAAAQQLPPGGGGSGDASLDQADVFVQLPSLM